MGLLGKLKAKVAKIFAKLKSFVKKAEDQVVGHSDDNQNQPPPSV